MNPDKVEASESERPDLSGQVNAALTAVSQALGQKAAAPNIEEIGHVTSIGRGTAWITGLNKLQSEEIVRFHGDKFGIAFNLDIGETGIVMLDPTGDLKAGDEAFRTARVVSVPVGDALIGRVVDPLGRPLDGKGNIEAAEMRPVEREAPAIMDRLPVVVPFQTGTKIVDALIPIGRGQRELLIGDRQTGKTAFALDAIINQKDTGVICIYCAIGQENSTLARTIENLTERGAMKYSIIVATSGRETPGLNFIAPYAATAIAEYFMDQGRDALIIYDDLTRHAWAYRELSLLLRRPPAREAFPGDIFYIHSRLLERSTHLAKGGSLTALPIIETEAQEISAYIPTNLISITDGQVYFSPKLFAAGVLPAIDVGQSVSRVGGKTQLPAYRSVAGDLRLSFSQFEELEAFARFGTRLDEPTRKALDRGRRVREIMKQPQFHPVPVVAQIGLFEAVTTGYFDDIPLEQIPAVMDEIEKAFSERIDMSRRLSVEDKLGESDVRDLKEVIEQVLKSIKKR